MFNSDPLPIDNVLPELIDAMKNGGQAVLQAPPGAGKTTRVPLAILSAGLVKGRIIMLEPRRLAARAAAERMSWALGENIGHTVGYRIRGDNAVSKNTRIEVVTEGILTRMIQSDATLPSVDVIIFDEFHERSLQADLGLALTLEVRDALREDLRLLVMSATLDAGPVAELMGGAPVVTSEGKSFPVETHWLEKPWRKPGARGPRFEEAFAGLIEQAVHETEGGILAFAPGAGEIQRTMSRLSGRLPDDVKMHALFGAMDFKAQRAVINPAKTGRKLVLATSIAETSLTIADIRVVVDGGLARRARFDPASAMGRLVTEKVTRAEATQRRGRAGRVASGHCYRLWTKGEEGGLGLFPPAEIEAADLTPLVLELALWGTRDASSMMFLTAPNPGSVAQARKLLEDLQALDPSGTVTPHGLQMAKLPLHPRLAHMVLLGAKDAPLLAALLGERDPLRSKTSRPPADLCLRMEALKDPQKFEKERPYSIDRGVLARIKQEAHRLKGSKGRAETLGELAALAYPDRVGLRRKGEAPRFILSGGKGAVMIAGDPLGESRMIVVTDIDGDQREGTIRLATAISESELRALFPDKIQSHNICEWSRRDRAVLTRQQERFGSLVLEDKNWRDCPVDQISLALTQGIQDVGFSVLTFSKAARLLIARIEWLRAGGVSMPDCSDDGLNERLEEWLAPYLGGVRRIDDVKKVDLLAAIGARLSWEQNQQLTRLAPAAIKAPTGTTLAVDYSGEQPSVSVRLQEMFGTSRHPTVGPNETPLLVELLSPARRPLQTTSDLPGFWQNSYDDVRKDMRGRYPKHPWPESPMEAEATRRAKPRK